MLKSFGQTSSTLSSGLPGKACTAYGPGVTEPPASAAAVSWSASTYTAACRAAAPTFAGSALPSSTGKDLISITVHRPPCTTTASGSR